MISPRQEFWTPASVHMANLPRPGPVPAQPRPPPMAYRDCTVNGVTPIKLTMSSTVELTDPGYPQIVIKARTPRQWDPGPIDGSQDGGDDVHGWPWLARGRLIAGTCTRLRACARSARHRIGRWRGRRTAAPQRNCFAARGHRDGGDNSWMSASLTDPGGVSVPGTAT